MLKQNRYTLIIKRNLILIIIDPVTREDLYFPMETMDMLQTKLLDSTSLFFANATNTPSVISGTAFISHFYFL